MTRNAAYVCWAIALGCTYAVVALGAPVEWLIGTVYYGPLGLLAWLVANHVEATP
jgi:hypothetical protein